jgi:hypothetical protein
VGRPFALVAALSVGATLTALLMPPATSRLTDDHLPPPWDNCTNVMAGAAGHTVSVRVCPPYDG